MARIRRSAYVAFHVYDHRYLGLEGVPAAVADLFATRYLNALSVLTGEIWPIAREELDALLELPSDDWVDGDTLDPELVDGLAHRGLVVTDSEEPGLAELREREELLERAGWNLYAALYHFMTRWKDVDLRLGGEDVPPVTRESIAQFVEERGRPIGAFHAVAEPLAVTELPLVGREGGLYDALAARRTTRGFDRGRSLSLEDMALVLYEVFGCHGTAPIHEEIFAIKRTSPSGGGLHPVEAYPLVTGVEGVEPGLYHYRASDHALELIERLGPEEGRAIAADLVAGQTYFADAHVSVILTARFPRSHWKYRRHQKAYATILMDAAHLSQTLYLVAADLGLGAYVTAAINSVQVDERLRLDGIEEGAIAMCGFGPRVPGRHRLEPRFTPYVPRETVL
jgi:putative peptide maturation dehydrogenase